VLKKTSGERFSRSQCDVMLCRICKGRMTYFRPCWRG